MRFSFDMFFAVSHYTEVLGGHVIYPIWFYEKDHKNGKPYPISPAESYDGEIDVTALDTERINKIVETLERMGADFIAVCPDDQHAQGFVYPHIAVRFSLDAPTDTMCQKVQKKLLSRS